MPPMDADSCKTEGNAAMAEQDYVPSTTCDFLSGNRMEVEAIFKEPLRRATKLGVDAPRLHMLAALLDIINEKQ